MSHVAFVHRFTKLGNTFAHRTTAELRTLRNNGVLAHTNGKLSIMHHHHLPPFCWECNDQGSSRATNRQAERGWNPALSRGPAYSVSMGDLR
jgi:hypothetical protein